MANTAAAIEVGGDGAGRDVSIVLFSSRSLRAVTLTLLSTNSWTARCRRCVHQHLSAPLHVASPTEIFAGGMLRITDDATGEERTATGLWHLRASRQPGTQAGEVDAVLTLPSERYVAAVLSAEAAPEEPTQSLRAMAILARTYALNGRHFTARPGHLPADVCDSTQCQAMRLGPLSRAVEDAQRSTAGETLWFGQHRAEVFFSQHCGGVTEEASAVWPGLRGLPYLHSHSDPYCLRRGTAAWHAEIPLNSFSEIAKSEGWHVPPDIVRAQIAGRSPSHRALRIVFTSRSGVTSVVSASALRFGIGRALGWNRVRSDAYELGVRNSVLVFDGRGHGHGVGLCQTGAAEMATEGRSAHEILAFYFPGTAVRISSLDEGWRATSTESFAVRSAHPLSAERTAALEQLWSEAQKRFPPRPADSKTGTTKIRPKIVSEIVREIIFAPTTEVFRQLTGQPGWILASTSGSTIVLQPDAVLRAHEHHESTTLLHEMLHTLVEAESGERAPLWLREGLVEVLADEPSHSASIMTTAEIESALQHSDSQAASEHAHQAAAARVYSLLVRYGPSTVRGWLSSGVPAGVL